MKANIENFLKTSAQLGPVAMPTVFISRDVEGKVTHCEIGTPPTPFEAKQAATELKGLKYDGGKPRFSLLRFGVARALEGVARVLTFGARKYSAHSWRNVEEGVDRYWSAMERHLNEIAKHGLDSRDDESGELHIDHVATNVLFISELIRTEKGIEG